MRYLTIFLAIAFGMLLSWIMVLNQQPVQVVLDTYPSGWTDRPVRQMPLWHVIFWSVFFGLCIGFLLTWGGGSETRRRLRDLEYDRDTRAGREDDEPDYVVGLSRRR